MRGWKECRFWAQLHGRSEYEYTRMSTHVSCKDSVYKEDFLLRIVFFFTSCNLLYPIRNIKLAAVSSILSIPLIPSFPATLVQRRPSSN